MIKFILVYFMPNIINQLYDSLFDYINQNHIKRVFCCRFISNIQISNYFYPKYLLINMTKSKRLPSDNDEPNTNKSERTPSKKQKNSGKQRLV